MKKYVFALLVLIIMSGMVLQGCRGSIQKDVQKLVRLQHQKNEKVRKILKCSDSQTRMILLNEIQELESKYNRLKLKYEIKYVDSVEKRKFEEAFGEAMRK